MATSIVNYTQQTIEINEGAFVNDGKWQTIPQYVAPLSLKVNGMVDQMIGIMPRKLFLNKSNELYFTQLCSSKGLSLTYRRRQGCVTEIRVGQKIWSGCRQWESSSLHNKPMAPALYLLMYTDVTDMISIPIFNQCILNQKVRRYMNSTQFTL